MKHPLIYTEQCFFDGDFDKFVKIHLNLGVKYKKYEKKTWSVRSRNKVVGHIYTALLKDVSFIVQEKGNQKIREGGPKTVHAFVKGELLDYRIDDEVLEGFEGPQVRYNPHIGFQRFCRTGDNNNSIPNPLCGGCNTFTSPIYEAEYAFLTRDWKIYVQGPK